MPIKGINKLELKDFENVSDIYVLQESGRVKEALKLAVTNEALLNAAAIPLNDWIDRGYHDETGLKSGPSIGR